MPDEQIEINIPEKKESSIREWFDQEQLEVLYEAVEASRLRAKQYLKSSASMSENEEKWGLKLHILETVKEIIYYELT
jgi:hypothetical protein